MARLTRVIQKIFGSTASANQRAKIGSLAAGVPVFTTDPATMQLLTNYLDGWFSVVVGANSPAIEDMNALDNLITRQLAYVFQSGVPEWEVGTTYYTGSFVSDGVSSLYVSLTDNNTGNALTSNTNWRNVTGGARPTAINPATQSPYVLAPADSGKLFQVNSVNGAMSFTLPAAATSTNFKFTIKDVGGVMSTSNVTVTRNASELLEGLGADYTCAADWGVWTWVCDGTNWYLY